MSKKKEADNKTPAFAAGTSVLDRLRKKKTSPAAETAVEPPQEATLKDIATAIAEVSGENAKSKADNDSLPPRVEKLTGVKNGSAKQSVYRYVNDTRSDIKKAHDSVNNLRKTMLKFERAQELQRAKISTSLDRAEAILRDLRDN